jgi:Glucodextranase, domain B
MTTRRGPRPTHVRPRPPSSGRPTPVKVRPRAPQPGRIKSHRPIDRGRGLPIVVKLALTLAVVALGIGVVYVGVGGLGTVAASLRGTFSGFIDEVTATPTPAPTVLTISDAPTLASPDEPYTNVTTVDLVVTVPAAMVGDTEHRIRVYLALTDQPTQPIQEVPIAESPKTVIPVELSKGINDFTVTIIGPGGESESSAVVRYVLDTSKPKVTITSPKNNAVINGKSVEIKGKVQARSTLIARNDDNAQSIAGTAEPDGTFKISLPLTTGLNHIVINASDPAGNESTAELTVRRGTGKLTVSLGATAYTFSRRALPQSIKLTATVTDPDGRPLAGADVTFTLSIPGIRTVTYETKTNDNGRASYETTIPKSAARGQGSATVLISSDAFGSAQDVLAITIAR